MKYRLRYHEDGTIPTDGEVFVFGSNLAGIHGRGAAAVAREKFGAVPGLGVGMHGQSYAIPTKGLRLQTLSLPLIRNEIDYFIEFASKQPNTKFFVTRIGCGLAGYKDEDIAPYFIMAPDNCSFPAEWQPYLEDIRA